MGKIEELIEKYKNIEKTNGYDPMESAFERGECAGESRVAFEIVENLKQLKSSLPTTEITELQAWKKIAEVTDTDEPKFNPADFYHDMRILFKNADLSVPIRGDKTLYDNGYRIVHKSSLPTQQDKVEVPEFVGKYITELFKKHSLKSKVLATAGQAWSNDWMSDDLNDWYADNADVFARAVLDGYTVEKEPLFIMPVPCMRNTLHYCLNDNGEISFRQGNAYKFNQDQLDKYFPEIKTMAVLVEEDEI